MGEIIRFVKKLFGKYETGYEYWICTRHIKVPNCYKKSRIKDWKWKRKMKFWLQNGKFESPILLHKDFTLVDGYSSVKIARVKGIDKVPVFFVD